MQTMEQTKPDLHIRLFFFLNKETKALCWVKYP